MDMAIPKAIASYKLKIVGMARHKLSEQMKDGDTDINTELLRHFNELNEQYKLLANYLERVVC
jgi:hypothetical protein